MQTSIYSATPRGAIVAALLGAAALFCGGLANAANRAPTISGSPPATVKVNSLYSFTPTAKDLDVPAQTLRFSILTKPGWASFSTTTGKLSGTPKSAGIWGNIRITVTDGKASATLGPFKITAVASSNRAPTISGTPASSITPGSSYAFTPKASDADGDKLTFSIANRPAWASFSTVDGRLSGKPTSAQVGSYSNIRISASDGKASASLPAFSVTVTDVANGSATLNWTPPTRNTNGSALTNLAGYRIYYGTSSGALNRTTQVSNAGVASYVVGNLSPATWYFAVAAYNTAGVESARSALASKSVK